MTRSVSLPLAFAALVSLASARPGASQNAPADSNAVVHAPPIVVTVSRVETPSEEVGNSITVVTREEIDRRQLRTVEEALRAVPGVSLVRTGGPGGATTVFLRGASSEHALVLLDGIELNDPSLPTGGYDFATLGTAGVERIEILRGPQSTVHGSSALGGVIHILTRRGEGPARAEVELEGGSFGTAAASAATLGAQAGWSWFVQAGRRTTDGYSAAPERLGNAEDDGSRSTAVDARFGRDAGPFRISFVGHLDDARSDIDANGPEGDDPNRRLEDRESAILVRVEEGAPGEAWRPSLSLSWVGHDRKTLDDPDPAHPVALERGRFEGASWKLAWLNDLDLGGIGRLVLGLETERERAATSFRSDGEFGPFESEFPERTARTTGAFSELRTELVGVLSMAIGIRIDDHDRFGSAVTGRVAPVVRLGDSGTTLRGTWGAGFKAPSLFQLYDPAFGAPGLDPERSRGWDAGVDQILAAGRVRLSGTVFGTRFEDLIVFGSGGYRNESEATARGLEATAAAVLIPGLELTASYTHTRAEAETGEDSGKPLVRRPRHQGSIQLDWTPSHEVDLALGLRRVGEREDLDFTVFPAKRAILDAYTLVRLAAGWRVADDIRVTGRIENLLDADYEEVLDFGTAGRAAFVGVEYSP